MSNGPMGGFMPTPAAPAQPPPVKLDTTATSRGNFNNFLKSMNGASALTPLAPSGMGAMMPQSLAPSPTSEIDIFNEPVQMMHQGGTAGNPLSGYGDFLSNQISNTQVEPFIQEIEQMASQRFNLDNSGGLQQVGDGRPSPINNRLPQLGIFNPPPQQDLSRPKMEVAEPILQPFNPMMQRPAAPFQMQGLGQPMRDKDGILREPMGLRGGPEMFNIDQQIFNDGIMPGSEQLMGSLPRTFFNGGEVDDFGDFSSAGDFSVGDTEDRSESDSFQDALDSIDLGSSDDSMFSDDPSSATPMGLEMPSTQNFSTKGTAGSNANFLTTDQLADIKKNINMDNEKILSEDDTLFENDNLTSAGQAELDKMNAETLQLVTSGEIPASRFISAGSSSDILGDADVRAGVGLDKNIDVFENIINRDFTRSLPGANLPPTIGSTRSTVAEDQARALANLVPSIDTTVSDSLQQNVKEQQEALAAQRGRALGPITFGDDLANFQERLEPFESSRVGDDFDTALNLIDRNEADRLAASQSMGVGTAPNLENLQSSSIMGRPMEQRTIFDPDANDREDTLGVLSPKTLADIERLGNVPVGQRKAEPGSDPTFFQGIGFPSLLDGIERFSRDRMASKLAGGNFPEENIVRNDSGRVVALKDNFGRTIEGVDPNEPIGGGDDSDPIIKRILPLKQEEEEEDKPPNVIGGIDIRPRDPLPTVVDSPFAPATSKIEPISFDSGELNKLIELLTGVSAKPVVSAAEGGLIRAVDDFLAIGR